VHQLVSKSELIRRCIQQATPKKCRPGKKVQLKDTSQETGLKYTNSAWNGSTKKLLNNHWLWFVTVWGSNLRTFKAKYFEGQEACAEGQEQLKAVKQQGAVFDVAGSRNFWIHEFFQPAIWLTGVLQLHNKLEEIEEERRRKR